VNLLFSSPHCLLDPASGAALSTRDLLELPQAVDGKTETGWAILPKAGAAHWAVFETREPVGFSGGTLLIVILDQRYAEAPLGRFRLSVTKAPVPIQAPDRLPELN